MRLSVGGTRYAGSSKRILLRRNLVLRRCHKKAQKRLRPVQYKHLEPPTILLSPNKPHPNNRLRFVPYHRVHNGRSKDGHFLNRRNPPVSSCFLSRFSETTIKKDLRSIFEYQDSGDLLVPRIRYPFSHSKHLGMSFPGALLSCLDDSGMLSCFLISQLLYGHIGYTKKNSSSGLAF